MKVMVRYRVKPEHAEDNARLVEDVFRALEREKPAGLRYASFRLADGVTFVHLAVVDEGAQNPLPALEAFRRFTSGIAGRCDEPPASVAMEAIGTYHAFE